MTSPTVNLTPAIDSVPSFKRVLLATDFSPAAETAFKAALRFCTDLHASLIILHVFEYADAVPPDSGGQLVGLESTYKWAQHSLNECLKIAREAGLRAEAIMKSGMAPLSILEIIELRQVDLAILGTNALHGFERTVVGSTAEEVLRKSPCPVLTVGPRASHVAETSLLQGPVVFATDFHRTTMHAIRYAAALCEQTKSRLHCLHVLPRAIETNSQSKIIPQIITEALQHLASETGYTINQPESVVAYGSEISNAVVDYARRQKAGLIVLGVRQASMIAAHAPAHIAYRIITEAPCPVLTMAFASHTNLMHTAACF
jgi:nucleotide-binding universal stress UspA family protein